MFMTSWYQHKAKQCARLAKEATDPSTRALYKSERKSWLEIATQIEKGQQSMASARPPPARIDIT